MEISRPDWPWAYCDLVARMQKASALPLVFSRLALKARPATKDHSLKIEFPFLGNSENDGLADGSKANGDG